MPSPLFIIPALSPPAGLPSWAPWTLILVGAAMLALWWKSSRQAPQRAKKITDRPGGTLARLRRPIPPSAPDDAHAADTLGLVEDLCARLDERAGRLEALLADAKSTIARLEALRAKTEVKNPARPEPEREPSLIEVMHEHPPARVSAPSDPLCDQVYALANAGADAVAIARELDEHIGKVQLILALRGG